MKSKLLTILIICICILTGGLVSYKLASAIFESMEFDEDVFEDLS